MRLRFEAQKSFFFVIGSSKIEQVDGETPIVFRRFVTANSLKSFCIILYLLVVSTTLLSCRFATVVTTSSIYSVVLIAGAVFG